MIRNVGMKFIAFVLAACFLVLAAGALLGVGVLGYSGLYDNSPQALYQAQMEDQALWVAECCLKIYTSSTLGQCPPALVEQLLGDPQAMSEGAWNVVIRQKNETLWAVTGLEEAPNRFEYNISTAYLSLVPPEQEDRSHWQDTSVLEEGQWVDYRIYQLTSPVYTVVVQLAPSFGMGEDWPMLEALYAGRYQLIAVASLSLLLFAALLVYLCCVAGRTPHTQQVRPGGLNRLPLDLYIGILAGLGYLVSFLGFELLEEVYSGSLEPSVLILGTMVAMVLSLLIMALLFALAAQLKTKGGYWWRNSIIGRCLLLIFRGLRWCARGLYRLFCLVPVIWRLGLIGCGIGLLLFVTLIIATQTNDIFWQLGILCIPMLYLVLLGYLCYGYGTLYRGVQKLKKGDLTHKISTRFLFGSFREFALGLNAISDAAAIAAQKQLRSERMKTELITNVSHDIKTPLTSIINYVDLLQKPHTAPEQEQYLEVLSRQSGRLKKLVEDLMEMSKASTGNITAEIRTLDATEAVTQALGEFSDKLSSVSLVPVLDVPEEPVMIRSDSRLLWRVLSNLLSNAVKYALPGTRLYISIRKHERYAVIAIKNVSREQLGIRADELMERFVRGDASRNTEGSGLGLNIAKSLMELQKGQLKLLVDGDLFKVTLVFPAE